MHLFSSEEILADLQEIKETKSRWLASPFSKRQRNNVCISNDNIIHVRASHSVDSDP